MYFFTGSSYWPIFIALSIAFLIFIVVVILGIKYIKIRMNETSPYVKPPSGNLLLFFISSSLLKLKFYYQTSLKKGFLLIYLVVC